MEDVVTHTRELLSDLGSQGQGAEVPNSTRRGTPPFQCCSPPRARDRGACQRPGSHHQQVCFGPPTTKQNKQGAGTALMRLSVKRVFSSWDRILGYSNGRHPFKLLNVLTLKNVRVIRPWVNSVHSSEQ